jgi:tryptophan halogenase
LLNELGEKPLMEPRHLRFTAGRRKRFWNANCVALGLASGFLEPLESTSIQLVISGVYNLLEHFPDLNFDAANIDSYNAELIEEMERIRYLIVMHYCTTQREDSELWRYCKHMDLPDSLRERIDLYRGTGRIRPGARELFTDLSWYYIFAGMSVTRNGFDPLVPRTEEPRLREFLSALKTQIAQVVHTAPPHDSYFAPGSKFRAEDIGA